MMGFSCTRRVHAIELLVVIAVIVCCASYCSVQSLAKRRDESSEQQLKQLVRIEIMNRCRCVAVGNSQVSDIPFIEQTAVRAAEHSEQAKTRFGDQSVA